MAYLVQILEYFQRVFESLGAGVGVAEFAALLSAAVFLIILSWLAHIVIGKGVVAAFHLLLLKTFAALEPVIFHADVRRRISYIPSLIVLSLGAEILLSAHPQWTMWTTKFLEVCTVAVTTWTIAAVFDGIGRFFRSSPALRGKPVQSYVQLAKILLTALTIIFVVSVLLERSPWVLLSGLGALTAVLLLVFRDSILGFVASIQVAANDTVRLGDWIEMPKFNADGDVIEISLNTVKVRNWDNTITSLPTYALASEPFKNWRGMSESGGRRIKRALPIDVESVRFLNEGDLEKLSKLVILRDYLHQRQQEIQQYNAALELDESVPANGRRLTNLGTFRAYVELYLKAHPKVRQDMIMLVRHLEPTDKGIPIEVYVFSAEQAWAKYECLQADIFDHLIAVLPYFDLRVYQSPSGHNFREAFDRESSVRSSAN